MRSKSGVQRWGSALILGACSALVSLAPREARADPIEGLGTAIAVGLIVVTAVAGTDVVFTVYDAVVASNDEFPSQTWALTELVMTAPQTLLLGGFATGLTLDKSDAEGNAALIPLAAWPGALTTHAIWSLIPSRVEPSTLFFASPAIAANTMLTASVITALFTDRRVFTRPVGFAEIMLTLPSVVGGAARLVNDPSHRPGWSALTAWSGALMLHGVASVVVGDPEGASVSQSPRARPYRRAAIAPRIDGFGPAPIAYDIERPPIPGLALRGVF